MTDPTKVLTTHVAVSPVALLRPLIYDYENYRVFLRDYFNYRKSVAPTFSYRKFAQRAGYSSCAFLKLVMDGKRSLTRDAVQRYIRALDLEGSEATFFRVLVRFNQAKSLEDRQQAASELVRSKMFKDLHPLAQSRFEFWSHWYHIAIRELIGLSGFQEDPAWIAGVLCPKITAEEAQRALKNLENLALVARDENGRLRQTQRDVTSGDEMISVALASYHRQMITLGRDSLQDIGRHRRQISAVTLGVSADGEARIKEMVHQFRKDLLAEAHRFAEPNRVLQINFQIFPLSEDVL